MDIWKWVTELEEELEKNGQDRLAFLIRAVPHYSVNDEHDQVDSLIPEALALCKQIRHPWLELYFRHWHLQSRVLERYEGQSALGDAVSLVDFAHQDTTKGCPQAICSIQDISSCYGIIDGCGYADSRLQVVKETLGKIDATWPCFSCLSSEYADALYDQNRHEEALQFLDQQLIQIQKAQVVRNSYNFLNGKVDHFLELGRYQEALDALLSIEEEAKEDKGRHVSFQIQKVRAFSHLHRFEEAKATLPDVEEIQKTPSHYVIWADAVLLLVQGGVMENNWMLGRTLQGFVLRLASQGAIRPALDVAETHAQLALLRGSPLVANLIVDAMEKFVPKLYKPLEMPKRIEELRKKIHNYLQEKPADAKVASTIEPTIESGIQLGIELSIQPRPQSGIDVEAFLKSLGDHPENNVERILALPKEVLTQTRLILARSHALQQIGFVNESENILRAHVEQNPNDYEVSYILGFSLLSKENPQSLFDYTQKLHESGNPEHLTAAAFLLGLYFHNQKQWEKSNEKFKEVLVYKPDSINTHLFLGKNAIQLQDWELADSSINTALLLGADPVGTHWLRLIPATMLRKWEDIRESAKQVGISLTGEGPLPVNEDWGLCQIQFSKEPTLPVYYAMRTGPVSARIIQVASLSMPQHYGDEVVFFANPLNSPEPDSENPLVYLFEVAGILEKKQYQTFDLDGVHPGEEQLETLRVKLGEAGVILQKISSDEYPIALDENEEQTLPGVYALVAIPSFFELMKVVEMIEAENQKNPHPLVYLKLAQTINHPELVSKQLTLSKKYYLSAS